MSDRRHRSSIDRRRFLKNSMAATAAAASRMAAPAVIPAQNLDSPVVYALIGTGSQGRNHLRNLSTLKSGRCAVLCDTYPPNLAKGVQEVGGRPDTESGDYRRVLERKDVEAVFITTPLPPARSHAAGCLERRKARLRREVPDERGRGDSPGLRGQAPPPRAGFAGRASAALQRGLPQCHAHDPHRSVGPGDDDPGPVAPKYQLAPPGSRCQAGAKHQLEDVPRILGRPDGRTGIPYGGRGQLGLRVGAGQRHRRRRQRLLEGTAARSSTTWP